MGNEHLYSHFHPDEHRFIDKAAEWVERAEKHELKLTDFLDPRQAFIVTTLVNRSADVRVRFDGGHPLAERQRAIIAPDYRVLEAEDSGLRLISVASGDSRLEQLDHGDYMGAVLGLGIKREKIGDIHVRPDGAHIVVAAEIADYIAMHLNQVHRAHIMTELLPLEQLQITETKLTEMSFTVASMRLDGIAGDVWRLSRAKVLLPIKAGRCKVNWKQEEDPSRMLKQGDIVSMKGFGRFQVLETDGITKSGRIRIKIGKYA